MERRNNYLLQAADAKRRFLTYDQQNLIRKFNLKCDDDYFYVNFLCKQYRLNRHTGDLEKQESDWVDGNSYEEVMTLLDILCDSREDRFISGKWQNMQSFGHQFHQNLLEDPVDSAARRFDADPEGFRRACQALGGIPVPGGDMGYGIELMDGLRIGIQFWHGDEEFLPRIRFLWDANAKMYLRYETMYFAVALLRQRIQEEM